MSRLEEIRDQIKTRAVESWEKFKETEIYQKLSDRYQTLSPSGQKIVKFLSVFLVILIVAFIPLSQLTVSKEMVAQFEQQRQLIRDMFKTYRESSSNTLLTQPPSSDMLMGSVNSLLQSEQLIPEQIQGVALGSSEGRLIPQNLLSEVIDVRLAKLNLRQVVDIGTKLSNISQAVKVKDILMHANNELAGYFDVTYKLYALKVPAPPVEAPPEPERKNTKGTDSENKNSKKSAGDE